jgi:hypothetical protein
LGVKSYHRFFYMTDISWIVALCAMRKFVPNYSPEPTRLTRRRWFRITIVVGGCAVLLLASFWLRDFAVDTYWNEQAMRYREDAGRVVYEDDPRASLELISKSDRYGVPWIRDSRGLKDKSRQLPVAYHPEIGDRSLGRWPYLFLHGRAAGDGRRLVAVTFGIDEISDSHRMLQVSAFSTSPNRGNPALGTSAKDTGGFFIRLKHDDRLRLFAGQPRADDEARFEMPFELNNASGKLVGQLLENGEVKIWLEEGNLQILRSRPDPTYKP